MAQWWVILGPVLAVFGVIGIGGACRRARWLTEEVDRALLQLVIRLFIPCLIFHTIVGDARLREPENVWLPPLVGFGTIMLGFAAAWVVGEALQRCRGLRDAGERRTFALCVGIYNYGYLPLPLAAALFDQSTMGVLFVHNVGVEMALWTVGIMLVSGRAGRDWWKRVLNAPSIAIVIALALNLLGPEAWTPPAIAGALEAGVGMLGACAIPVALLLIGATIADHLPAMSPREGASAIAAGAVLRLGLLPAAFLALAAVLPASVELTRVVVLQAAMPAAVLPIVLSRHYGGDTATALRVVIGTSILSLVTIPLWLAAGLWLLGIE